MTDQPTLEPWSPRGDRILALLPAEHPSAFERLPFEEQQVRGRVYLMTLVATGNSPYSWWVALDNSPGALTGMQELVADVPDERIAAGLLDLGSGPLEPPGAPVPPA